MKIIIMIIFLSLFNLNAYYNNDLRIEVDNEIKDSKKYNDNYYAIELIDKYYKPQINYRQFMRDFVKNISEYAKNINLHFFIIPQNGQEIVTLNGYYNGTLAQDYIGAIDGVGRESLIYGYNKDNKKTPVKEIEYMKAFLDRLEENNIKVLVTDYCSSKSKIDDSYNKNLENNYISFAATKRDLTVIPNYPEKPYNVNSNDITNLNDANNFLYLINPAKFSSKQEFVNTIKQTNYDIILIDLFFNDEQLTENDISLLKIKKNGGKRLVICYMSIGEAEDYRYYWKEEWNTNKPNWLEKENPNWKGNYKVKYWNTKWQNIIYGNNDSYLKKILDIGFDGVYLDIIDGFEYFEQKE